jgi:DNA (cytosine-5)-methyltransferase 1
MWLSPDCKHFSKAKGGRPVEKKIRGLAWVAYRWAKEVRPAVIALENVEEFVTWGPLGADGKPCPLRKGFTFRRFVAMLSNLGYTVDWRELVAADYGAPTTRKRLFLVARCDGEPIVWPEPTHARRAGTACRRGAPRRSASTSRCRARRSSSRRTRRGRSGVKRPLAENTMRRIARGLQKFVLDNPKPFIVGCRGRPVEDPLQTITLRRSSRARERRSPRSFAADQPLRTQCARSVNRAGGTRTRPTRAAGRRTSRCARNAPGFAPPYAVPRYGEREGQEPRALSLEQPSPTIVPDRNGAQLVAAFMAKHNGGHEATGQILERPLDHHRH